MSPQGQNYQKFWSLWDIWAPQLCKNIPTYCANTQTHIHIVKIVNLLGQPGPFQQGTKGRQSTPSCWDSACRKTNQKTHIYHNAIVHIYISKIWLHLLELVSCILCDIYAFQPCHVPSHDWTHQARVKCHSCSGLCCEINITLIPTSYIILIAASSGEIISDFSNQTCFLCFLRGSSTQMSQLVKLSQYHSTECLCSVCFIFRELPKRCSPHKITCMHAHKHAPKIQIKNELWLKKKVLMLFPELLFTVW